MNPKVQECLVKLQADKKLQQQQEKEHILHHFGLCHYLPAEKDYEGTTYEYNDKEEYGSWKIVYEEVSDEEYKELLKYYNTPPTSIFETFDDKKEKKLQNVAYGFVISYIIMYVIYIILGFYHSAAEGLSFILIGGFGLLSVLISYWTISTFTNISRRATKIHQILEKKR